MEFRCPCIVRISSRYDTAPAWATTAGGQVGIVKTHAIGSQCVGAGRLNGRVAIAAEVFLGDIVRDEEDEVLSALAGHSA